MGELSSAATLPLAGLRVVEFSHMVMGPAVGAILAELGAEVIKIEPIGGDATRELVGSGAGYFPMYNRNKKSLCLDLKDPRGLDVARRLATCSDILVENFRSGALERLGLGHAVLSELNPGLIYCSQKGFLSGPYEHRTALDEVAQMMGGLAYMTGPPGRPLRAGASVIDVAGGMFGVIGILAALEQRHRTGLGQKVTSSLYETTAYLVGQHMAQFAVTGQAARPMPVRISAWAIYDIFETGDGEQVFLGVVSDPQWSSFCGMMGLEVLLADDRYRTNALRVAARDELLPPVREAISRLGTNELLQMLERAGLPFAPVRRPEDLFDDPHLNAAGGLVDVELVNGRTARLPILPLEMAGRRPSQGGSIPGIGQDAEAILAELGLPDDQVATLLRAGVVQSSAA